MAKAKPSWSYKAGEKGRNRVRVFEERVGGVLLAEFYELVPGTAAERRVRLSLGHRDREAAKQYADDLAARFRKVTPVRTPDLTLGRLLDMYEREVTPSKAVGTQKHDRRARVLFERCWGSASVVKGLDRRDWDRSIRLRRTGQLKPNQSRCRRGVRDRMIEQDLRFMNAVCNWALTVRENGEAS
jgi:hypothetical protein